MLIFKKVNCSSMCSHEQESCLQKFMLPEPVLCIGGILQIELLGRVQTQEMDGLYYIWSVFSDSSSTI